LSNGSLNTKVTVTIDAASKNAIKAVEKAGGKVILPEVVVAVAETKNNLARKAKKASAKIVKAETADTESKIVKKPTKAK
jgi:hypothetical protein